MLVTEPLGTVSSRNERAQAFGDFIRAHAGQISGRHVETTADGQADLIAALQSLRARAQVDTQPGFPAAAPAIITGNAVVTLRVVEAVARLGWRLGRDIGLLGIDDPSWTPYVGPGISAVAQPTGELGRLAARCLLQRLEGMNVPARKLLLPGSLVIRGSTCHALAAPTV